MLIKYLKRIGYAEVAAVGTWAMVMGISLEWLFTSAPESISGYTTTVILLFIIYIVFFMGLTQQWTAKANKAVTLILVTIPLLCAFAIMWLIPISFLSILSIIWVAILPHYMTINKSIIVMLIVVVSWFAIYTIKWNVDDMIYSAMLWGSFHFFSILMTYQAIIAEKATSKALQLNQELKAAQQLLEQATRQNERTRIARDLHDLVGHHLTALSINLQVAGHLSEGEAKQKVDQCYSLSKLLLSDVRDAVSTMRDNQQLDFNAMVSLILENIPNLTIHNQIDTTLHLDDLILAKSLLSIIQESLTNCLRHSKAKDFLISMTQNDQQLQCSLYDNGQCKQPLKKGNGLKGMQERVAELEGDIDFNMSKGSLHINIFLPLKTKRYTS